MGYITLSNEHGGADRIGAPDVLVAALSDAVGRPMRAGCLPFVLSFDGPYGRHYRLITAQNYLEMVVEDHGPVFAPAATVDAIVETTLATGVLVLDLADMDELDIDLMKATDQ